MSFIKSLSIRNSRTKNGAVTLSTSLNPILDLFFIVGTANEDNLSDILKQVNLAYNHNKDLTTRVLLWARDIRQGAGRREVFKEYLNMLSEKDKELYSKVIKKVPELGRYDDIITAKQLYFAGDEVLKVLDFNNKLCCKWMPREKSSKSKLAKKLMKLLNLKSKDYRKLLVTNTEVVENKMCAKKWDTIEYAKVPSKAMTKYCEAFEENDFERYNLYKKSLVSGETKVNTSAVYPHDILSVLKKDKILANEMWLNQKNWLENSNKTLFPIIDVSSSMYSYISDGVNAVNIAIALGLYLSEKNKGDFKDYFITFSGEPELVKIEGDDLYDKVENIRDSDWGNSTDIQKVFDLILGVMTNGSVHPDDLPSSLVILSDMEFDEASEGKTNFEEIKEKFNKNGYNMPELIFWNINGGFGNIPVTKNEQGVCLISGFSPSIVKSFLSGDLEPEKIMFDTINNRRYDY